MMPSIGKLNVLISASTDQFEKAINSAQKTLASFAAKATAPITSVTAGLAGIGGLGALAATGFLNPITGLAKMFPGGELATTAMGLTHLNESVEHTVERTKELFHSSEKLGISPKFMRGLQIAAGPAADQVDGFMMKFERFLSQLSTGEDDLGRKTTGVTAKLKGLVDVQALLGAKNNPEKALRIYADALKNVGNQADRVTLLTAVSAKSGLNMAKMLENIDQGMAKGDKFGVFNEKGWGSALAIAGMEKELKLRKEAAELAATSGAGLLGKASELAFARGNIGQAGGLRWQQMMAMMGLGDEKLMEQIRGHLIKQGKLAIEEDAAEREKQNDKLKREQREAALQSIKGNLEMQVRLFGQPDYIKQLDNFSGPAKDQAVRWAQELQAKQMSQTPMDKVKEQFDHILMNKKFSAGGLDNALTGVLENAFNIKSLVKGATGAVPFIDAGSQAEYALRDAMRGKQEESKVKISVDQLKQIAQQQLKEQEEQTDQLRDVLDELRKGGPAAIGIIGR